MRCITVAVLVLGVTQTLSAAIQQDSVTAEVIQLRFGWPAELRAEVDAVRYQIRTQDDVPDSSIATMAYDMLVEPHAEGLVIRLANFQVTSEISARDISVEDMSQQLMGVMPALVVSTDGELLRLDNLAGVQSVIRGMVQPIIDSLPQDDQSGLRQLVASLTSPEFLLAQASEDWNAMVGVWLGVEFEVGALYESNVEEPSPLFPDRMIPTMYQFSIQERTPCTEEASDSACVLLEMLSFPEPDAVAAMLEDVMKQLVSGVEMPAFMYEELAVENWVQVVTEPGTLVPHFVSIEQFVEGTIRVEAEGSVQFTQRRGREYYYTYPER